MARTDHPVKYCRYCGRLIRLDAVNCPYCDRNVVKQAGQRECPFCGEVIRDKALKCRHCGEFLDGRESRLPQTGDVLYIDKAIITGPAQQGQLESKARQLEPAMPVDEHLQVTDAEVPGDRRLSAPPTKALQKVDGAAPPALTPVPSQPVEAPEQPVAAAPAEPATAPPLVQYECPSCSSNVFEADSFCENCGRDLSVPAGKPEFKPPTTHYEPTHYALLLGAAAPVGLLFSSPFSLMVALAAILLALWCMGRIAASAGQLRGMASAGGGLAAGAFWLFMILAFAS